MLAPAGEHADVFSVDVDIDSTVVIWEEQIGSEAIRASTHMREPGGSAHLWLRPHVTARSGAAPCWTLASNSTRATSYSSGARRRWIDQREAQAHMPVVSSCVAPRARRRGCADGACVRL